MDPKCARSGHGHAHPAPAGKGTMNRGGMEPAQFVEKLLEMLYVIHVYQRSSPFGLNANTNAHKKHPFWRTFGCVGKNLARTVGRRISRAPNFPVLVSRERRRRPPQAGRKGRNYRMRKPTAASLPAGDQLIPGVIYVTHVYPLKQTVAWTEEMNPNLVNDDGF